MSNLPLDFPEKNDGTDVGIDTFGGDLFGYGYDEMLPAVVLSAQHYYLRRPEPVIIRQPWSDQATPPIVEWIKRYVAARGLWRIWNEPEYRFYRTDGSAPDETDTPFETASSLPHECVAAWADGDWFISTSYFNGVIDSGFLPLGARSETYRRLRLVDGEEVALPPYPPFAVRLEPLADGDVRIVALHNQGSDTALHATEWAVAYTFDGTDPVADDPDYTETITGERAVVLDKTVTGGTDGQTFKVLVQTRTGNAEDGYAYSETGITGSTTLVATGPDAITIAHHWSGRLPSEW